jgi:hypothetical protein
MPARKPDLAEFDALERSPHPSQCKLARLMNDLGDQDRVNLDAALAEGRSNLLIVRWFKTKGLDIRDDAVGKHRRGDCVCRR